MTFIMQVLLLVHIFALNELLTNLVCACLHWCTVTSLFTGTSWHRAMHWCGVTGTLYVADFNNDGNDDLLCHEKSTGKKWIAYNRYPRKGKYIWILTKKKKKKKKKRSILYSMSICNDHVNLGLLQPLAFRILVLMGASVLAIDVRQQDTGACARVVTEEKPVELVSCCLSFDVCLK